MYDNAYFIHSSLGFVLKLYTLVVRKTVNLIGLLSVLGMGACTLCASVYSELEHELIFLRPLPF